MGYFSLENKFCQKKNFQEPWHCFAVNGKDGNARYDVGVKHEVFYSESIPDKKIIELYIDPKKCTSKNISN